ncbi:hypothetical protein MXB_2758 [Myxobolus squamalis]|nr:hypothetical protein MXB_2758 [Myxobolus squamalis]
MPPKKNEPSKKTVEKQKQKIVEVKYLNKLKDKTFGLKNKKGKKQQSFVQNVSQQMKGQSAKQIEMERIKNQNKKLEEEEKKELKSLFKPVVDKQKIDAGVDPKSVVCSYFKLGLCTKGDRCHFSHDLSVEWRSEKKDMYNDNRPETNDIDQEELESIIEKKHSASNSNASDKICKHFIESVEKKLYGWFWVCPNGGDACRYRHALPPGYILKRDKAGPTRVEEIPIEEIIESERANLVGDLTPVTEETFKIWKTAKIKEKRNQLEIDFKNKKEEMLSGKITSKISGKEAFALDPSLIKQDDEEAEENLRDSEEIRENILSYEELILSQKISSIKIDDSHATKAISLNPKYRVSGQPLI